jgi:hypothetical protein
LNFKVVIEWHKVAGQAAETISLLGSEIVLFVAQEKKRLEKVVFSHAERRVNGITPASGVAASNYLPVALGSTPNSS